MENNNATKRKKTDWCLRADKYSADPEYVCCIQTFCSVERRERGLVITEVADFMGETFKKAEAWITIRRNKSKFSIEEYPDYPLDSIPDYVLTSIKDWLDNTNWRTVKSKLSKHESVTVFTQYENA